MARNLNRLTSDLVAAAAAEPKLLNPRLKLKSKRQRTLAEQTEHAAGYFLSTYHPLNIGLALEKRGITMDWLISKQVELVEDPKCPAAARLRALAELSRLRELVAGVHPQVEKERRKRQASMSPDATEADRTAPRTFLPDPFENGLPPRS